MRDKLIELGFEELPHKTIGNCIVYYFRSKHNKTRVLSISDLGNCNEMVSVGDLKQDLKTYEDLIVVSNYDYDGNISLERIKALIIGLTSISKII